MRQTKKNRSAQNATSRKKARLLRNVIVTALAFAVVVTVLFGLTTPGNTELEGVETFPDMGREHLEVGDPLPDYNSTPATSGPHAPRPAACGTYRQEIPDAVQVHHLEHGTVVIQYQPSLSDTEIAQLEDFARSQPTHILVAPRTGLGDRVVLTAWTKMLRLNSVDLDSIGDFYDRYARLGPEPGVACPITVDE